MLPQDSNWLVQALDKKNYQSLCPNRIWNVWEAWRAVLSHKKDSSEQKQDTWKPEAEQDKDKPSLLLLLGHFGPKFQEALTHEDHSACSFDFCEFSSRNFTAVRQYHEPMRYEEIEQVEVAESHLKGDICFPLRGLFNESKLAEAVEAEKLTAWKLDGSAILDYPGSFMAISHVWSDGTGAGTWASQEVNECLYRYFRDIALQFQCQGIWWDTICVPNNRVTRMKALNIMDRNYEYAKITLVHDRFLRKLNFESPENALFAIVMSPWFTRGWTALELAKSRVVKVVFKDSIKDLDKDILHETTIPSIADLIKKLRCKIIDNVEDLLLVMRPRYTSWLKDRAAIAGLLTGVPIPDSNRDTFQRDTYQKILKKIKKVSHEHLFHRSVTMSGAFNWCATSLFQLPRAQTEPELEVDSDGSVVGFWRAFSICKYDDANEISVYPGL